VLRRAPCFAAAAAAALVSRAWSADEPAHFIAMYGIARSNQLYLLIYMALVLLFISLLLTRDTVFSAWSIRASTRLHNRKSLCMRCFVVAVVCLENAWVLVMLFFGVCRISPLKQHIKQTSLCATVTVTTRCSSISSIC
jgi:heme/copper-type cytochrome/quinol oxidase subunit 2